MNEDTNMSIRKFFKQVGVTSQQRIEAAIRDAGDTNGKTFEAKITLTVDGLNLEHTITGEIEG